MKNIDAESAKTGFRDGKVHFEIAGELFKKVLIHQLNGRLLDHLRRHFELIDRHYLAVNLDLGRRERRKEQI